MLKKSKLEINRYHFLNFKTGVDLVTFLCIYLNKIEVLKINTCESSIYRFVVAI